jgi:hypothetical protein
LRQHVGALSYKCLLARREFPVQREKKIHETGRQVLRGIKI